VTWELAFELSPLPATTRRLGELSCPYWRLSTKETLRFMRWELNRWLGCLEWLYASKTGSHLTYSHIVMGTMLARLARASINNEALEIDYNMSKDVWTTPKGLAREGLDLKSSMTTYKLGWLPARKLNWEDLCLRGFFQDNCSFQYNALRTAYQTRRGSVIAVHDTTRYIQHIAAELQDVDTTRTRRMELLNWLHRICFREFAQCVLKHCQKDFRTDLPEPIDPSILSGERGLSWDMIEHVLGVAPRLYVIPNRENTMDWAQHIQRLFDWDDGLRRQGWEKQQYRVITQHAYNSIEQALGTDIATNWRRAIGLCGCRHFSIIPHTGTRTFQVGHVNKTENRERRSRGQKPLSTRLWKGAFHLSHDEDLDMAWDPLHQLSWLVGGSRIMHGNRDPINITDKVRRLLEERSG
jgi:hypothetical protein